MDAPSTYDLIVVLFRLLESSMNELPLPSLGHQCHSSKQLRQGEFSTAFQGKN